MRKAPSHAFVVLALALLATAVVVLATGWPFDGTGLPPRADRGDREHGPVHRERRFGAPRAAVVYAVGDLCAASMKAPGCAEVGDLIGSDPRTDAVLALGDQQYPTGSLADFESYYDAGMGEGKGLKDKTYPVPGNHEYRDPAGGAQGYFEYWGPRAGDPTRGYYSVTVGSWRLVAANSSCEEVGGCGPASAQGRFLREQLATAPRCALVFDHHPAVTDGEYAPGTLPGGQLFSLAFDGGAELFLSGHDHVYERFPPLDGDLAADPARGVRQFVVGTGGKSRHAFSRTNRSEFRQDTEYGALRLVLTADGYSFAFLDTAGRVLDAGSGTCH
jgi:hypothetical protein